MYMEETNSDIFKIFYNFMELYNFYARIYKNVSDADFRTSYQRILKEDLSNIWFLHHFIHHLYTIIHWNYIYFELYIPIGFTGFLLDFKEVSFWATCDFVCDALLCDVLSVV